MNLLLSDEEKLKVFKNEGLYLPTKKIGKNNPKAEDIAEANEARKEWNSVVDEALFYNVPAKHIKVIKYYKIIKVSKRIGITKDTLSDTKYYNYQTFIGTAGKVFLSAIELAIDFLKGLIEIYKAIIEPKNHHDEKNYKKYEKIEVIISDLESKRGNAYSRINYLENRLSMKDYKLIGGKKQLQNEIQLLNKEAKRIDRQIDKTLNEVGVTDIRDFRTHCRELKMIKDNYEQDKKRFKEAKLNHEERVREYMADVKDSNVEIYEREKKYVRSR